jgi:hypothetical protein
MHQNPTNREISTITVPRPEPRQRRIPSHHG